LLLLLVLLDRRAVGRLRLLLRGVRRMTHRLRRQWA
jgi:hypothetical protein